MIASLVIAGVLMAPGVPAEQSTVHRGGCRTHACRVRVRHKKYIRPYRGWFLGPVGACESGTGSYSLKAGLRAVSPSGQYRGRYQFGIPDWYRAGGTGDPINAGWLEQAYRAVRWLHINGRGSWPNC